jgi:hypothetical protein
MIGLTLADTPVILQDPFASAFDYHAFANQGPPSGVLQVENQQTMEKTKAEL